MSDRPLLRGIRILYAAGAGLALGAAFMTYVLSSRTGTGSRGRSSRS